VTETQALDLMVAAQQRNSHALIGVLQFLTNSISFISIGIPLLVLLINETKKNKTSRRKILIVLIAIAFAGLVSTGVKNIVQKPRPFTVDKRIEKLSGGGSYSFPSGHATEAVTATIMMIFTFRYWYVWFFYISWAAIIMYSRMALGVHDLFDLLGGVTIASGSGLAFLFLDSKLLLEKKIS
jgi:undecaprenyl-diphosphatase